MKPDGDVFVAGGVVQERIPPAGGVAAGGRIMIEGRLPAGGVIGAGGVDFQRLPAQGGVLVAGRVGGQGKFAVGGVFVTGGVGHQRPVAVGGVVVTAAVVLEGLGAVGRVVGSVRVGGQRQIPIGLVAQGGNPHRAGDHVGQPRAVAREITVKAAAQGHAALMVGQHGGGQLGQRHGAGDVRAGHRIGAGGAHRRGGRPGGGRINRVGRGREGLERAQGAEPPAVIRPRSQLQPVIRAVEHFAKVQRDGEQAVGDRRGGVGQRAKGRAVGGGIIQRETQIVGAGGGGAVDAEAAVVSKRRAQGAGGGRVENEAGQHRQRERQMN